MRSEEQDSHTGEAPPLPSLTESGASSAPQDSQKLSVAPPRPPPRGRPPPWPPPRPRPPSQPGPRADLVGLVHQVNAPRLVGRQPGQCPVALLQPGAQRVLGRLAAEHAPAGPRLPRRPRT